MTPVKTKSLRRKSASINTSRWTAYATAGVATALAGTHSAEANITYSGILNQVFNDVSPGGNGVSMNFQLQPGAVLRFGHSLRSANPQGGNGVARAAVAALSLAGLAGFAERLGDTYHYYASKLPFGRNISTQRFYSTGANNSGSLGPFSKSGYLAAPGYPALRITASR